MVKVKAVRPVHYRIVGSTQAKQISEKSCIISLNWSKALRCLIISTFQLTYLTPLNTKEAANLNLLILNCF